MSAPLPVARVTGAVTCALCGQVAVVAADEALIAVVSLVRAHQRSEACSGG